ncbi:hypothetical protein DFS34DRAFT_596762 [Phlyctochytrium arcticum]|nr:hypothetical protein DFS34DRAFT_596762 [Phlyctochytrium arcticum]
MGNGREANLLATDFRTGFALPSSVCQPPDFVKMAAASIVNINSANILRFGALGLGALYGYTHKASLTKFVEHRHHDQLRLEKEALIEEAKIAYEAAVARENHLKAVKEGIPTLDSDSYRYDADRWLSFTLAQNGEEQPKKK